MTHKAASDVLVGEIASVLNECAGLICTPSVEEADGVVTLTVRVDPYDQPTTGGAFATVELLNAVQRVIDVGTLRAVARRYDIDLSEAQARLGEQEKP